ALFAEGPVGADQERLRAPDGRDIEEEPAVAGDPEASRVGDPVAVEDDDVRLAAEPLPCGGEGWELPEREEPRHVGELNIDDRRRLLDRLERLGVQRDDRGVAAVPLPADREVRSGDATRFE